MEEEFDYLHTSCINKALLELKKQQDQLDGSPSSCFSSLLSKLFRVDTIPFLLYTEKGPFELAGFKYSKHGKCDYFHTSFFRIENIDIETQCAVVSLLRPFSLNGFPTEHICDMERLERTDIRVSVDLTCFCAVQCLSIEFVKKIVIEPKW